jgi:hypothetical protein
MELTAIPQDSYTADSLYIGSLTIRTSISSHRESHFTRFCLVGASTRSKTFE